VKGATGIVINEMLKEKTFFEDDLNYCLKIRIFREFLKRWGKQPPQLRNEKTAATLFFIYREGSLNGFEY